MKTDLTVQALYEGIVFRCKDRPGMKAKVDAFIASISASKTVEEYDANHPFPSIKSTVYRNLLRAILRDDFSLPTPFRMPIAEPEPPHESVVAINRVDSTPEAVKAAVNGARSVPSGIPSPVEIEILDMLKSIESRLARIESRCNLSIQVLWKPNP